MPHLCSACPGILSIEGAYSLRRFWEPNMITQEDFDMVTPTHLQIKFAELAKLSNMHSRLADGVHFSDEEFFQFCQENKHLKFEKNKEGDIIVMTPTGGKTSSKNSKIIIQIGM